MPGLTNCVIKKVINSPINIKELAMVMAIVFVGEF